MGDRFLNRYRSDSLRLQNWDYTSRGIYFITICTNNRLPYFGEIINDRMHYSPLGAIANVLWYEIKNRTKNCQLGEFVIMPNHIHGNIILTDKSSDTVDSVGSVGSVGSVVETRHALSLRSKQSKQSKQLGNPVFKIRAKIPYHQLLVHINLQYQNMHIVLVLILNGRVIIGNTLSVMKMNYSELKPIYRLILQIGYMTN